MTEENTTTPFDDWFEKSAPLTDVVAAALESFWREVSESYPAADLRRLVDRDIEDCFEGAAYEIILSRLEAGFQSGTPIFSKPPRSNIGDYRPVTVYVDGKGVATVVQKMCLEHGRTPMFRLEDHTGRTDIAPNCEIAKNVFLTDSWDLLVAKVRQIYG